ncbi:glycosyltransferase [Luteimonas sp. BDR2-5]|uniref:glycosyltransferase n=1 Tax=Proluteimonas luteida TaxID=2878685 RepID=UPI001E28F509|nr:glycosyltransferase [Luteimonas sp. BDR2-5]MCD9029525.1 glycosyltransferase [Luteimonas sp. BDR2-5]
MKIHNSLSKVSDIARPKVSVITGYYNRANFVDSTILSILNQTYINIELIAFDDRSSDGTGERMLDLQDRIQDDRLKVIIHERNKGFTVGMIDAIASSSGEYICVQGSGDISLPDRIARQVEVLDKNPEVGAVGCWYTNIVSTTGARRPCRPSADEVGFDELFKKNVFSHGEVMMRRSVYEKAGGYRAAFKFCQDIDLWLRISRIAKLATVQDYLYERFVRFDGVSYDPKKFAIQARYSLLARRIALMSSTQADSALRQLEIDGPLVLVEQSDKDFQRHCLKAVIRSMIFGGNREAEELAEVTIVSPALRKALIAAIRIYALPLLFPVRKLLPKAFGVST